MGGENTCMYYRKNNSGMQVGRTIVVCKFMIFRGTDANCKYLYSKRRFLIFITIEDSRRKNIIGKAASLNVNVKTNKDEN